MKKFKSILCLCLLACLVLCTGFANEEGNLIANGEFAQDEQGAYAVWSTEGAFSLSKKEDAEMGEVLSLDTQESQVAFYQTVQVNTDTIYCMTLGIRGQGSAKISIRGLESSYLEEELTGQWQYLQLYGLTGEEQENMQIQFTLTDARNVEIEELSCLETDEVPEEATYVWLYDRDAYEEEQNAEQAARTIHGTLPALLIAGAYAAAVYAVARRKENKEEGLPKRAVYLVLGGVFVLSTILALAIRGHQTDINCFTAWAGHAANVGPWKFYTTGMWADYPPGYILVLWLVGLFGKLFGMGTAGIGFAYLVKLPAILADVFSAYLVYKLAKKRFSEKSALCLCALMALNPMSLLDSAAWGQIDSILTLLAIGSLWCYTQGKKPWAAALFVLGVLVKPQMLVFGPLLAAAFIADIVRDPKQGFKGLGISALYGIAVLLVVVLPFSPGQEPLWLWNKYTSAAGSYPYATVNAFNLYALFGGNWMGDGTELIFGITVKHFGIAMIVMMCIVSIVMFLAAKEKKAIFPAAAVLQWGIFLCSHAMHERYLFPAMLLLMISYCLYGEKKLLAAFGCATAVTFLNSVVCLFNDSQALLGTPLYVVFVSLLNIAGFAVCVNACLAALWPKHAEQTEQEQAPKTPQLNLAPHDDAPHRMHKKDWLLALGITAVYAVVALINLGSTKVPESVWRTQTAGESAILTLAEESQIQSLYFYPGVGAGTLDVQLSDDGVNFRQAASVNVEYGQMYTWQTLEIGGRGKYVKLISQNKGLMICEAGLFDDAENRLEIVSVQPGAEGQTGDVSALTDEQSLINTSPTYMDEMYFDEIYHARTAYEHLHGMPPYENTHPPLGKVFIMLGVWLFGMNPFGWRIVGTLFGIGMLPLMYALAKRVTKSEKWAALATFLFAADGMHFVQTRIATIDVYGVFFIMAMCLCMMKYWQMNFYVDGLKKTFRPLGACGVLFGFAIASKWIGFYAGAGLAVAFFTTMYKRYREYKTAKALLEADAAGENRALCEQITSQWLNYTIKTLLFCIGFFILIPAAIYLLSYLPYLLCAEKPYTLSGVWDVQTYMFDYHSTLTATHPFQSPWYQWPLMIRPIYYYACSSVPEGMMRSIAAFGNPAVWWTGLLGVIACMALLLKKAWQKEPKTKSLVVYVLICLAGAFLPWVFITRATFIYHYFASVPFIILCICIFGQWLVKRRPKAKWAFIALAAAALALFVLFYPVWSGAMVNRAWALKWLRWMPSWWFF